MPAAGRRAAGRFDVRTIALPPGHARPYDPGEWRDALVVVGLGEVELEFAAGARRRFGCGAVLWLARLSLRTLRNPGAEPAVLVAVTRNR